jgi:hypothetical protein
VIGGSVFGAAGNKGEELGSIQGTMGIPVALEKGGNVVEVEHVGVDVGTTKDGSIHGMRGVGCGVHVGATAILVGETTGAGIKDSSLHP